MQPYSSCLINHSQLSQRHFGTQLYHSHGGHGAHSQLTLCMVHLYILAVSESSSECHGVFIPQKIRVQNVGEGGRNDVMEAALILQAVNCPHIVKRFGCLLRDVCYQYLYVTYI